ncbi:MAG: rimI [Firmicutes bacterium]|nr:rimI [Bacillota bacterium]
MQVKIVPMDRSHIPALAALERQCFSVPWSQAMLEEELFNDTASFLVAESDTEQVLGYAGLYVVLDEGYIGNVAVNPAYRRQGIARRLVEVYCRFAQERLAFLTLEVRAGNQAAIALYEGLEFQEVGRRKHYYQEPVEDAIIMTRHFRDIDPMADQ